MSFLSRIFGSRKAAGPAAGSTSRSAQSQTVAHFKDFAASRPGCEAFIEPATRVTQTTMVLVAGSGEWTRRKVPDEVTARKLATQLGVPAFDVNLSGYPSRMREWNETHRKPL
ncbi:oxidoreductase [Demequina capsici]|uniref:Oxidoreductase n=1 Tax=Demequina capsici TaxID=3075620 RepID=A0AA96FAC5_9MICO|nr:MULTISPECIES: oxidoreductase [unclassified Demequina]WNM25660.1 oxidoreductase [Demequina sp. OYTSA14]WNM28555.1 oxidoreductase [Demequina sp. PMTSA13]